MESKSMPPPPEGFFPQVYDELRRLAASQARGGAGGAHARRHGAGPRGLPAAGRRGSFGERSGFLRAAAVAMQRILVDHARRKRAAKRGGNGRQFPLDEADRAVVADPDTLLDIDEALNRLAVEDPTSAEVARFRLFAGLSIEEAAEALGLSRATAFREWAYARSWLTAALAAGRGEIEESP